MSVVVKNLIPPKQAENAQTTQYTAINCKARIDKFTITNTTAGNVTISVNIVPAGLSVGDQNKILNNRTIAAGETYTCPELVGQVLESGGFISSIAGASSALTIAASGVEIT